MEGGAGWHGLHRTCRLPGRSRGGLVFLSFPPFEFSVYLFLSVSINRLKFVFLFLFYIFAAIKIHFSKHPGAPPQRRSPPSPPAPRPALTVDLTESDDEAYPQDSVITPRAKPATTATNVASSDSDSDDEDTDSEYLSFSEAEGADNEPSEEQHRLEREAREAERQRVLEAAGLIVKKDGRRPPPRIPRVSKGHRPPPAIPDRSSIVSDTSKDLPIVPDEAENAIRLDDAFERYEAFKFSQSQSSPSTNRLSAASFDAVSSSTAPSPTATQASLSRIPNESTDGRSYSSLLNFLGRSRTPGNETERRPNLTISAPISGPIMNRGSSPVTRESSPGFGTVSGVFSSSEQLLKFTVFSHGRAW